MKIALIIVSALLVLVCVAFGLAIRAVAEFGDAVLKSFLRR